MYIFLLIPLPALITALFYRRINLLGLIGLWLTTTFLMVELIPIGSRDFEIYLRDFYIIQSNPLSEVIFRDPLYSVAVWVAGYANVPSTIFFLSFASLALAVKLVAIHKLGNRRTLPIALYMCSFFFLHEFTQMRAGLAIGLWMIGLSALGTSRGRYLMWTLLASFIHIQAVVGLLIYPLAHILKSRLKIRAFAVVAVLVVFLSILGVFTAASELLVAVVPDERATIYLAIALDSPVDINQINILSILAILTALVGLLPRDRHQIDLPLNKRTDIFIYVSLIIGSCALAVFSTIPVVALRISEHFFSLIPIGVVLAADHIGLRQRNRMFLWALAGLLLYLFLFHFTFLLDPSTGLPSYNES